ncbi:exonuclease subunit SbcD [Leeia sp. TBRC 13508]|uniref:Nuclease SbcCD subunit D n=1 Tax=Leeia speluncae TaxID=2884804 RepID=A0ABS8D2E2_9NEIS|nr:exonuclease subunit SbcD [Leeia speluncae]MCB6182371.1 exonuclease subunit SbcD [Leeia speluncae]
MRILHTSDWHFGQSFMGKNRHAEHEQLIAWLLQQVDVLAIDAVIIAGDIFDTGAPPSYARELYNRLIVGLHEKQVGLVILGGNHDSVAMLAESKPLLTYLSTSVIPGALASIDEEVVVINKRDGTPGAVVCAVPFLRPRDVQQSEDGQSADDKQAGLMLAIEKHYDAVYQVALAVNAKLGGRLPMIATGHLTTIGASVSESVRDIYVGSLSAFPASGFPPVDYIALGHIHRPQVVKPHIRYCGSPIPLSFDELGHEKQMLLVSFEQPGTAPEIQPVLIPNFQPMASIKGDLATVEKALKTSGKHGTPERPVWVEVEVETDDYLSDLTLRLQTMVAELPIEILRIKRARGNVSQSLVAERKETLAELSVDEVFLRRLSVEVLDEDLAAQLTLCHQQIASELQEPQV